MSSSRSRLVAATTRTSTGMASVPPTGIASRSWSTRSSLTCVAGDISPISSRKNVPPRAATDLLLELFVLGLEEALLRRPPADRDQVVVGERLLDVVEGALVHRLDGALQRRLCGHQDDRRLGILLAHGGEDVGAGHARHLDVGEHDVGRRSLERLEARLATLGGDHVEPLALEEDTEHVQDAQLVVDHQNRWLLRHAASSFRRAAGKYTVNVVPFPSVESTSTSPRCASTARCTMASPRPVPPTRPVTNGSNRRARRFSGMPGPLSLTARATGFSIPAPRGSSCGAGRPVRTVTRAPLPAA